MYITRIPPFMSISNYYEQICKEPLLTAEEEKRLLLIYKSEDSTPRQKHLARERLILANLRFVFKTAKKYSRRYPASLEDLISSGNEGLLVAIDKYDINSGNRLLTYAGWWIMQRILKEMSRLRLVSLPIWKQQVAAKIAKLKEDNEELTTEDILKQFPEVPEKDVRELAETAFLTCFIDDLSDKELNPIEFEVEDALDHSRLHDNLNGLTEEQRAVVLLSWGFDDGKEKNSKNVAKELGISKDEVTRIKREAMEKLKSKY